MELSLHPKQAEVLFSPATEILFGGAAGPGKSHLMRAAAIIWCNDIPGLQAYIFRRTRPDLFKNHMQGPKSFPGLLAPWVKSKKVKIVENEIRFNHNGSCIHLCHCQYEKDMYDYQGAEIHVLFPDELTSFPKSIYAYLRGRVRMIGIQVPPTSQWAGRFPRICAGTNPGGIGHNWVKADFPDLGPGLHQMPDSEGGMLRQFIPALMSDNPDLLRDDPGYRARLQGLGNPALVRAMELGDWNIVAGGMFDDLWNDQVHVIRPFKVPSAWRIDRSFDWGSSKPYSVGWWAESNGESVEIGPGQRRKFPRGTLIRIAERYGWNGKPNEGTRSTSGEIGREVLKDEKLLGYSVKPGPADSSIFDVENGKSIADDMALVGVRWIAADKGPGSRKQGWLRMRALLKASLQRPQEDPGLFIFDTCRHFIRTLPVLPRDPRDPDDVDTKAEDHVADEARYRLMTQSRSIGTIPVRGV